ncbi:hypothetical protein [Bacillus sp. JJ722]|uniref:hypothetical protein n=1 Tax=Bacillus sp. JJ722 TaxID=3122973 RepID=UPI00300085E0
MFGFRKLEEQTEYEETIGVVIHITPAVIYLFISEDGELPSNVNSSSISMRDMEGRYMEIGGSYITLQLDSLNDIDKMIKDYGLDTTNLPVIRRFVEQDSRKRVEKLMSINIYKLGQGKGFLYSHLSLV